MDRQEFQIVLQSPSGPLPLGPASPPFPQVLAHYLLPSLWDVLCSRSSGSGVGWASGGDTHRLGGACLLPAEAAERPACVPGWRAGSLVRKDVSVLCGTQTPPGMWLWARIPLGKKG